MRPVRTLFSGRVKVLDFGLAKLADAPLAAAGLTALPTTPSQVRDAYRLHVA